MTIALDRYLKAIKAVSIDIVELGFRSFPKNTFMGPYVYTTDEFINQLDLPEGPVYGVMINGDEFISILNIITEYSITALRLSPQPPFVLFSSSQN